MKFLNSLIAVAFALHGNVASAQTAHSQQIGTIATLSAWSYPGGVVDSPTFVSFALNGAFTNPRACNTFGEWQFVLDNATTRAMYAALLAAKSSGQVIFAQSIGAGVDAAGGEACIPGWGRARPHLIQVR